MISRTLTTTATTFLNGRVVGFGTFLRNYSTATQQVLVEKYKVDGVYTGVSILKLNKPNQLNALTFDLGGEFKQCVDELVQDKDLRAVILTGNGKAFSAGGDLSFLWERSEDTPQNNAIIMEKFYRTFLYIRNIPVPIISAINGHAIGAGLCLALATDIRLASNKARMGLTFVDLGISPGMAATHFLPKIVGSQVASRLLLSGDVVSGEEARRLGLVLDVYEPEQLLPNAIQQALKIAQKSPISVQLCTKTLRNSQNIGLDCALTREADSQAQCYANNDIKEGITAIKESRPPNFSRK